MHLVDSHCHLDDAQFEADRDQVIERARAGGLKYVLTIGTGQGPPDLSPAIRIAEEHAFVLATVGVHPNDAAKVDSGTFRNLEQLLLHQKVRAVGEIGLDYHWGVPKELQLPAFERQLEIAAEAKMPVVIHTRDAWQDTIRVLRERWARSGLPCVMHCFTGTADQARECLDMGFYLAFGGVSTFPKASEIREAARITPSDRLLLETDAPYLAPVPHRGRRNEPVYVTFTAQIIAKARSSTVEELAAQTTANFEHVFCTERQLN
ncbi:MAG: TatD family hydrolase [Acidobacteriaceae bacterium]|nr:TatD family hydrolase [Acidobacteriaceae bacterium]